MSSGPETKLRSVLCLIVFVGASGCAATSMIGRSTKALENTAKSMNQTRDTLRQSDQTMKDLVGSLDKLHAPMNALGALSGPMRNLGALQPSMERLGARLEGVETNLKGLETPLENLGSLPGSLDRVRELEKPLQAIANVARDKSKLVGIAVGFLVAWIVATFLGVYTAFVMAMRRGRAGRQPRGKRSRRHIEVDKV